MDFRNLIIYFKIVVDDKIEIIFLYIWSPCRTTGHFLLLVFDDFESSLTILSLVHLVFIMGSSPLDMSLKRVLAMDYNSF